MAGTNRTHRAAILDDLERRDPERAAELRALRATNPQAYRKAVAHLERSDQKHESPAESAGGRGYRRPPTSEPLLAVEIAARRAAGEAMNRAPTGLVGYSGPLGAGKAVESVRATAHDDLDAAAADLRVLDGTLAQIKATLATGSLDRYLDALIAAELSAKARKGVLTAFQARRTELETRKA